MLFGMVINTAKPWAGIKIQANNKDKEKHGARSKEHGVPEVESVPFRKRNLKKCCS